MIVNFCVKFKKRNAGFIERKTHGKTTGIKAVVYENFIYQKR